MEKPEGIYFHGCAWGMSFYIGVYKILIETYGVNFGSNMLCYGDSMGALMALFVCLNFKWNDIETIYLETCKKLESESFYKLRSSDVHNHVIELAFEYAEKMYDLDREEIIKQHLIGKYFIGVTEYYATHSWYNYTDYNSLKEALHGSFHIPIYCRKLINYNKSRILDGSYSFNPVTDLPNQGKNILKISVGDNIEWCDICPETPFTMMRCAVPDTLSEYLEARRMGIDSTISWTNLYYIKEKNKEPCYKCAKKEKNTTQLMLLWPIRIAEDYLPAYKYIAI